MMGHAFHDMLNNAVDADAAHTDGSRFAHAYGSVVTRRVRRRRAARTVGVGSVAAVSVGAVALGATQVPWGNWGSISPASSACPPGTVAVTPAPLAETESPLAHSIDVSAARQPGMWLLWDDVEHRQVFSAVPREDGLLEVVFVTGEVQYYEPNSDGAFAFAVPTGGYASYEILDLAEDGTVLESRLAWDMGAVTPLSPLVEAPSGAPTQTTGVDCVSPNPSPVPSLSPSPAASSLPQVGDAEPISPLQCGFIFDVDTRAEDEWEITEASWMDPMDAWLTLGDWYDDPLASFVNEPTEYVAYIEADGSYFAERALTGVRGGLGEDHGDGVFRSALSEGFGSESLLFAAAVGGQVIAVVGGEEAERGFLADRDSDDQPTAAFLLSDSAFAVCPGVDPAVLDHADIYGVSTVAELTDTGNVESVQVWRQLPPRP